MDSREELILQEIDEAVKGLGTMRKDAGLRSAILATVSEMVSAIRAGNKVMICGNGGSAADAQHMAGEFVCKFYKVRAPLPGIALSTDTSVITAVSNDYSFDDVFARQVKALGKEGDILLCISTSGRSGNVLKAIEVAGELGIRTILLTGSAEEQIDGQCDIIMKAPSKVTPRIQEFHLFIEHIICELVEKAVYE
jgi:D-sedoheptulose 7-phosphate isomerase